MIIGTLFIYTLTTKAITNYKTAHEGRIMVLESWNKYRNVFLYDRGPGGIMFSVGI